MDVYYNEKSIFDASVCLITLWVTFFIIFQTCLFSGPARSPLQTLYKAKYWSALCSSPPYLVSSVVQAGPWSKNKNYEKLPHHRTVGTGAWRVDSEGVVFLRYVKRISFFCSRFVTQKKLKIIFYFGVHVLSRSVVHSRPAIFRGIVQSTCKKCDIIFCLWIRLRAPKTLSCEIQGVSNMFIFH